MLGWGIRIVSWGAVKLVDLLFRLLSLCGMKVETLPKSEALAFILNEMPSGSLVTAWVGEDDDFDPPMEP